MAQVQVEVRLLAEAALRRAHLRRQPVPLMPSEDAPRAIQDRQRVVNCEVVVLLVLVHVHALALAHALTLWLLFTLALALIVGALAAITTLAVDLARSAAHRRPPSLWAHLGHTLFVIGVDDAAALAA
jgi:hypothetical protein